MWSKHWTLNYCSLVDWLIWQPCVVWCVCVHAHMRACACVCVLSPSFSFLSDLMDLMYSTSSTPGHVCLAEPTRGGWLVPPPSACLLTCLVWSGQMPADSLALFFFFFSFLILSFSHDRHGWTLPPSTFFHVFPLLLLSLSFSVPFLHHHYRHYAPPPPPVIVIWHFGELPNILLGYFLLLRVYITVLLFESQTGNFGNVSDICCSD